VRIRLHIGNLGQCGAEFGSAASLGPPLEVLLGEKSCHHFGKGRGHELVDRDALPLREFPSVLVQ
jgi:hypothetical protein